MRPALGLAWADMVGTRLVMYRDEGVSDETVQQVRREVVGMLVAGRWWVC